VRRVIHISQQAAKHKIHSHQFRQPSLILSPQSQSFSRSYGSILPTSLIYVILLARGC